MADYAEVQHGYRMLHEYFNSGQNRPTFLSPFDAVQPGVALDALNRFDQYWNNPSRGVSDTNVYCFHLAAHPERRSPRPSFDVASFRRKRFGPRCHGFSRPALQRGSRFSQLQCPAPSLYPQPRARVRDHSRDNREHQSRAGIFSGHSPAPSFPTRVFWTFALAVTCVKHEGFREEREWRILYLPGLLPAGTASHLEEEVRSIGSLPQVIYKLPIDAGVPSRRWLELGWRSLRVAQPP